MENTTKLPKPNRRILRFGFFSQWQQKKLAAACLFIALCFFIGNDTYRAQTIINSNKKLFSNRTVVGYINNQNKWSLSRMVSRNRIYGKARLFPELNRKPPKALKTFDAPLAGTDVCGAGATQILSFPYTDTGTTVGAVDNYNLPADTTSPTLTGCPTCTATGAGPVGSLPRGAVYTGTGTGPDVAYRVTFSGSGSMNVTASPAAGYDLALVVYTNVCSNNLADAIVIDDTGVAGGAESVSISSLPAGTYHIVIDGYSTGATPPGPSGAYSLNVTGTGLVVPTSAGVSVSGQVRNVKGAGVSGVRITVTDSTGNVRSAVTNTFGFYKFENLPSGNTYTFEATSRKLQFANPVQIVSLSDNVSDLNFETIE